MLSGRRRLVCAALVGLLHLPDAAAQFDYSVYGVADLSYGRFESSGFVRQNRLNSNSLSSTFGGVNASYGFDGGWKPGINLETFFRFEDFQGGRRDSDPFFSRNAFASLASPYGTLRVGRQQTLLFDTTTRFNALGNSIAFGPAVRHVFLSGNLESVQGDFYWDRAIAYLSPNLEGVTISAMYSLGPVDRRSDLAATSIVWSYGLLGLALSGQRVHFNDGFTDSTNELTLQAAATYNFGFAKAFGEYTRTNDHGLEVRSSIYTGGLSVPFGPSAVVVQLAYTRTRGLAVDRRHRMLSGGYIYSFDSVTDFYFLAEDDRVRGQTKGVSYAGGVRWRF